MGVCHRISSPGVGGLVTTTGTNPHLAPPMPVWGGGGGGVVGHNIDTMHMGHPGQKFPLSSPGQTTL